MSVEGATMIRFRDYRAPSPAALADLKARVGLTGNELADLVGLSDGRQWRKYTGGIDPREMSAAMLFALAAQLELDDATLERVARRMREIGAQFDTGAPRSPSL